MCIRDSFEAARADAARGEIHHADKSGVVVGIGDQTQIGQRVFDLGALEKAQAAIHPVSYTHLRAHETVLDLVCRLLLEKKNTPHTQHTVNSKIKTQ